MISLLAKGVVDEKVDTSAARASSSASRASSLARRLSSYACRSRLRLIKVRQTHADAASLVENLIHFYKDNCTSCV